MSTGLRPGAGRLDMSCRIPETDTKGSRWQPLATPCRRFLQSKPWRRVILRKSHPIDCSAGCLAEPTGKAQLHWVRNSAPTQRLWNSAIVTKVVGRYHPGHMQGRHIAPGSVITGVLISPRICLTRAQKIPGRWPPRVQEPCFKTKEILQAAAGWFSD